MFIKNIAGARNEFIGLDAALKKALGQGFALYSPDELSYFRVGDGKFDTFSEYITSTTLLMKYRLLASFQGLDPLKESMMQIALAFVNVSYEFLKLAQEIIRIALFCLKGLKDLLFLDVGGFILSIVGIFLATIKILNQIVRIIPACILFVAGIIGVGTRHILNAIPLQDEKLQPTTEIAEKMRAAIGCNDVNQVKQSIEGLQQENRFFSNKRTALEKVVDSPCHFLPKIESLIKSKYRVNYNDDYSNTMREDHLSFILLR